MQRLSGDIDDLVAQGKAFGVEADVQIPNLPEGGVPVLGNSGAGKTTMFSRLMGIPDRMVGLGCANRQTSCATRVYNINKPGQPLAFKFRTLPKIKDDWHRELSAEHFLLTFSTGGRLKHVSALPSSPQSAKDVAEALQAMVGEPGDVEAAGPLPTADQVPWVTLAQRAGRIVSQTVHQRELEKAWNQFGGAHAVHVEEVNEGDLSQHPQLARMGEATVLTDLPGMEADAYINHQVEFSVSRACGFAIALMESERLENLESSAGMLLRVMLFLRADPKLRILLVMRNHTTSDKYRRLETMLIDLDKAISKQQAPDGVTNHWLDEKIREQEQAVDAGAAQDALYEEVEARWEEWVTAYPVAFLNRQIQLENLPAAATAEDEDEAGAEHEEEDEAAPAPSILSRLEVFYYDQDNPAKVDKLWDLIHAGYERGRRAGMTDYLDQCGVVLSALGCAVHEKDVSLGRPKPAPELVTALRVKAEAIAEKFQVKGLAELKWLKLHLAEMSQPRMAAVEEKLAQQLAQHPLLQPTGIAPSIVRCINDYLGPGNVKTDLAPAGKKRLPLLPSLAALLAPLLMCAEQRDDAAKAGTSLYDYVMAFRGTTRSTAPAHQLLASFWQEVLDVAWKEGIEKERTRLQVLPLGEDGRACPLLLKRRDMAQALTREKLARMLESQRKRELRKVVAKKQELFCYTGEAGVGFITEQLRVRGPWLAAWLQGQNVPDLTIQNRTQGIAALVRLAVQLYLCIRGEMRAAFRALVDSTAFMARSVAAAVGEGLELMLTPEESLKRDATSSTNLRKWFYWTKFAGKTGLKAGARRLQKLMEHASQFAGGHEFKSLPGVHFLAAPELVDDAGAADGGDHNVARNTREAKRRRMASTPSKDEPTATGAPPAGGGTAEAAEDSSEEDLSPDDGQSQAQPQANQEFMDQDNLMMLANIVLEGHMAMSPALSPV